MYVETRCSLAFPKVGKGLKQENCAGITDRARLGFFKRIIGLLGCLSVLISIFIFPHNSAFLLYTG